MSYGRPVGNSGMPTTGLEPVRPFEHWSLKPACLPIPARGRSRFHFECSGRDSNPHGVNPHRILNPARLPIPPSERLLPPAACRDGAEGNRTPDLLNAIQALSQLSYGPNSANVSKQSTAPPARRRAALDGPPGKTRSTTHIFKQTSSGADGTRTRGLRCDRPAL